MSTDSPTSWSWTFGDGSISTEQHPIHFYLEPGSYTVTLTATNAGGSRQYSSTITIGPYATKRINYYPGFPVINTPVQFVGAFAGAVSWAWDFGDGQTSSATSPTHVYSNPGTYTVTLNTVDVNGSPSILSVNVTAVASQLGPTADSDMAKTFLDMHNRGRDGTLAAEQLNPTPDPPIPPLAWSQNAADIAQSYANKCIWNHNAGRAFDGIGSRGENLWASSGTGTGTDKAASAVQAWVNEWTTYTYSSMYQASAGHFTQVVWRNTLRVGCSRPTVCPTGLVGLDWTQGSIIVCNYEPSGNYAGQYAW